MLLLGEPLCLVSALYALGATSACLGAFLLLDRTAFISPPAAACEGEAGSAAAVEWWFGWLETVGPALAPVVGFCTYASSLESRCGVQWKIGIGMRYRLCHVLNVLLIAEAAHKFFLLYLKYYVTGPWLSQHVPHVGSGLLDHRSSDGFVALGTHLCHNATLGEAREWHGIALMMDTNAQLRIGLWAVTLHIMTLLFWNNVDEHASTIIFRSVDFHLCGLQLLAAWILMWFLPGPSYAVINYTCEILFLMLTLTIDNLFHASRIFVLSATFCAMIFAIDLFNNFAFYDNRDSMPMVPFTALPIHNAISSAATTFIFLSLGALWTRLTDARGQYLAVPRRLWARKDLEKYTRSISKESADGAGPSERSMLRVCLLACFHSKRVSKEIVPNYYDRMNSEADSEAEGASRRFIVGPSHPITPPRTDDDVGADSLVVRLP